MIESDPSLPPSPDASTNAASAERPRFFALVREALAGSRRDLTRESLGRSILLLAVPMVLEMIMESIFAVVDIFWVSKLGPDAIAAVGLTESLLTIVYAAAMGLSMGAMAVVSRRMGEKDSDGAARAAVQALLVGALLAIGIGVLGALYAPKLLAAMALRRPSWRSAAATRA